MLSLSAALFILAVMSFCLSCYFFHIRRMCFLFFALGFVVLSIIGYNTSCVDVEKGDSLVIYNNNEVVEVIDIEKRDSYFVMPWYNGAVDFLGKYNISSEKKYRNPFDPDRGPCIMIGRNHSIPLALQVSPEVIAVLMGQFGDEEDARAFVSSIFEDILEAQFQEMGTRVIVSKEEASFNYLVERLFIEDFQQALDSLNNGRFENVVFSAKVGHPYKRLQKPV